MASFPRARRIFVFIVAGLGLHLHTAHAFLPALSGLRINSGGIAQSSSPRRSLALGSMRCSQTPLGQSKVRKASTSLAAGPVAAAMGSMPPVTMKGVILLAVTIILELAGRFPPGVSLFLFATRGTDIGCRCDVHEALEQFHEPDPERDTFLRYFSAFASQCTVLTWRIPGAALRVLCHVFLAVHCHVAVLAHQVAFLL